MEADKIMTTIQKRKLISQPQTKPTTIDPHKLDKYLPRLLNGEANKLETWLPNLLATPGLTEREKYDYRTTMYRKQNLNNYNTNIASLLRKLEKMKEAKAEVIAELTRFKNDVDNHHEKTHRPLLF